MGFCVVYNLKRELIMDGGLIAHFYVCHDTFLTDLIAACPAIAEVRLLPCSTSTAAGAVSPDHGQSCRLLQSQSAQSCVQ